MSGIHLRSGLIVLGLAGVLAVPGFAWFQAAGESAADKSAGAESAADVAVSEEATRLEGELGKFNDATPEAAEVMLKLTELYHQHGRVFGLIRTANRFVASHPNHKRHADVMVRLMDGLEATSRRKELIVLCRQFLARYSDDARATDVARRLAATLERQSDRAETAEAQLQIWKRNPNVNGRDAGARAIELFAAIGSRESITKAAELSEEMLDRLPAGQFSEYIAWRGFHEWRRIQQWAPSNAIGLKMLKKGLPKEKDRRRQLHQYMAENYGNLGQHANSVTSMQTARSLGDSELYHSQLIQRMHNAQAKPAELEPLVRDFLRKYPQSTQRYNVQTYLAFSYSRNNDPKKAASILARYLAEDAMSHNMAWLYVDWNGNEPADLAASEKTLLAAIAKCKAPNHKSYLRHALAFNLYRNRMKVPEKSLPVMRQSIADSPTNHTSTSQAISTLLSSQELNNQFKADVQMILKSRRNHLYLSSFRNRLAEWAKAAKRQKEQRPKAEYVEAQLAAANRDPLVNAYIKGATYYAGSRDNVAVRESIIKSGQFNQLSYELAQPLTHAQSEFYRVYGGNERSRCTTYDAALVARFPKEPAAVRRFLYTATDYGPKETAKEAALAMLKLPPEGNADTWRRVMLAADKNEDAELAKQAFQWVLRGEKEFGPDARYASFIGSIAEKYEMKAEALAWWKKYMFQDVTNPESLNCVLAVAERTEEPARSQLLREAATKLDDFHGRFSVILAHEALLEDEKVDVFEKLIRDSMTRQAERPFRTWGVDTYQVHYLFHAYRAYVQQRSQPAEGQEPADVKPVPVAEQRRVYTVLRDMGIDWPSAVAALALLELEDDNARPPLPRLLDYQRATMIAADDSHRWDQLMPFAQAALAEKKYAEAATLLTGMLTNQGRANDSRRQAGRDMVGRCYARMGSVGLTIDESSPIAPLLQSALYLRLGDEDLAFETYSANRALFNEHRSEVPIDLLLFVCERHIAASGDENHEFVEQVLRGWLIDNGNKKEIEVSSKARVQLLLARNFFKAQRYDVARSEFTTVINLYKDTPQAIDAEFGVGEAFMAQKVYDEAEKVFSRLARSRDTDVTIRAEFLRGVLTYRRGDRDEARDIFRAVLERVPNVELANQALFNLSEVYGEEERYIDQLNLLRTVGRLGRSSKRWHHPGTSLSIVVQDSDLGISRGHNKIPVLVRTEPGGDEETIYLVSGGAGKGLFRADLETRLGGAVAGDHVLQLTGNDRIRCDYPEQFKDEFKHVPLSEVEIRIASDAEFAVASSRIVDEEEESFSDSLRRESQQQDDQRVSQGRPSNQIKPGNLVYFRSIDPDRDLSNDPDTVVVKLAADSGDQVQVTLTETGPHTGIFEGSAQTAELPAGALASDTSIEHGPLKAIDRDPESFWLSQPDGATPKDLTVDMKDLEMVSRVRISTPQADQQAPVRGTLRGSNDGRFWFRIASNPPMPIVPPVDGEYAAMTRRVYEVNPRNVENWNEVVSTTKSAEPVETTTVETLEWERPESDDLKEKNYAIVWHGKLVQERTGAARISISAPRTGVVLDGRLELKVTDTDRTVDVWLERGVHELAIFALATRNINTVTATIAHADNASERVVLRPFRASDFDLGLLPEEEAASTIPPTAFAVPIELTLEAAKVAKKSEKFGIEDQDGTKTLTSWQAPEDAISWQFTPTVPGEYAVWATYAHAGGGSRFDLQFGEQQMAGAVADTGGWAKFERRQLGTITITETSKQTLAIKPADIQGGGLMNLRGVTLTPTAGPRVLVEDRHWELVFPEVELRYVRLDIEEYLGEAVAISNFEISHEGAAAPYIPTEADVLALASNDTLEIAGGDLVTATYTDELTQTDSGRSRLLTGELTATYFNADITPIAYDFDEQQGGAFQQTRKELMRIEPGERIIVEITDYDRDASNTRDTIEFEVVVNDGEPVTLTATETDNYTGMFTKEVDTSAKPEKGKLQVKPGDRVYCRYLDQQNTFPGHSVPRETVVYVNEPSEARITLYETRVIPAPEGSTAPPRVNYFPPTEDREVSGIAFEAPLTVEVIDPDAAKDSLSEVVVGLKTTDGATLNVRCVVSSSFSNIPSGAEDNWALREGRFVGQVVLQLGGKSSPQVVPLGPEMPRNLVGGPAIDEEEGASAIDRTLVTSVLNLTGQDTVTATYRDERRPDGKPADLPAQGRLISNGALACTDRDYDKPLEHLHVGERLYLLVTDADRDQSDDRDTVTVEVSTDRGEKESITLEETLAHSGIFTGSLQLKPRENPEPGNLDVNTPVVECYFGDLLTARYVDTLASTETGTLELSQDIPVVVGTDGLVAAFSKTFNDEKLAVETKFHIAESYFELFKSHKKLARDDEQKADLESGRRVLREVMEDYPDPKHVPRIAYLLGQFAQELEQWREAVESYEMIVRQYPDHPLAPDAQYKLAQSFEESGDFDEALEAYVTLAATYPKSPLIANVMIRISDHFYKNENFEVAAQVGEKFLERFEAHQYASRIAFRVGQCYFKSEKYRNAGTAFDEFAKRFPDDALCSDAMFWSGESYRLGRDNSLAFRRYNRCRWDFPASEAAKYARGRLALPEMLQQFEREANSIDNN